MRSFPLLHHLPSHRTYSAPHSPYHNTIPSQYLTVLPPPMRRLRSTLLGRKLWHQPHIPRPESAASSLTLNPPVTSVVEVVAGGRSYYIEHSLSTKPRPMQRCIGLGERLYDCEVALAQHLARPELAQHMRGKRCIELGAGLGLASLVGKASLREKLYMFA